MFIKIINNQLDTWKKKIGFFSSGKNKDLMSQIYITLKKKLVIFQLKSVKIGEEGADGCVRSDVVQMQVDCSQPDSRQNHYV